jgi:hypothetical protein
MTSPQVATGRSYAPRQAAKTTLFAAENRGDIPKKAPQAVFSND